MFCIDTLVTLHYVDDGFYMTFVEYVVVIALEFFRIVHDFLCTHAVAFCRT